MHQISQRYYLSYLFSHPNQSSSKYFTHSKIFAPNVVGQKVTEEKKNVGHYDSYNTLKIIKNQVSKSGNI
jgi:hypothetical protein